VVGVTLLVVIVTIVVGRPTRPTVTLALERTDTNVRFGFSHRDGEPVDRNRTSLAGVGDGDALAGTRFQAGDTVRDVPVDDEVTRVWPGENTDHRIRTFDGDRDAIPHGSPDSEEECGAPRRRSRRRSGRADATATGGPRGPGDRPFRSGPEPAD
jgi:hypothetical protein